MNLAGMIPRKYLHNACLECWPERRILSILDDMNAHYTESVTVKDFADSWGMSEKYFITYFKSRMGISPKQYLVECRMKKAAGLLADSGQKIGDIAEALGYADQYSFAKAFKKYYEETPTDVRNRFQ